MSSDDSDDILIPNNVFSFQGNSTVVSAKGPNVNTTFNFRGNNMNMPVHVERRYAGSVCDQRSYYGRETSPMSLHSASVIGSRNFNYRGGSFSQRSMIYRRGGSPMSVRSTDSNISTAAIALAFENGTFDIHDVRMIKELCTKFQKQRNLTRVDKHRHPKFYGRRGRSRSGYDSGELGSDSSVSSDECKSVRSCRSNMTTSKYNYSSCRSTNSDFRRNISHYYRNEENTQSFRPNGSKNMFPVGPSVPKINSSNIQTANYQDIFKKPKVNPKRPQTNVAMSQNDKFKNGFVLPSQRFNSSLASLPEKVNDHCQQNSVANHTKRTENDNDDSNINGTNKRLSVSNKRNYDLDNDSNILAVSSSKRCKLSSPNKEADKTQKSSAKSNKSKTSANKSKDFVFIVPKFPVRKTIIPKVQEKLISKSAQPLTDAIEPNSNTQDVLINKKPTNNVAQDNIDNQLNSTKKTNKEPTVENTLSDTLQQSNNDVTHKSDVSMRPSFIKRKLFTQKLDVTERKNTSSDNIQFNSPQTSIYSAIAKEKNKARKLVTSQLCLSRDVTRDNNNFLDLIHKIVPANQMNLTNVTNKTDIRDNKEVDDDKWDVTSVISTCNKDDASDTYTDEEIFNDNQNKGKKTTANKSNASDCKKKSPVQKEQKVKSCKVTVEKLPLKFPVVVNSSAQRNCTTNTTNCAKSFWDTDFESDVEAVATPIRTLNNYNKETVDTEYKTSNNSENTKNRNAMLASAKLTRELEQQTKHKENVDKKMQKDKNEITVKEKQLSTQKANTEKLKVSEKKATIQARIILENGDSSLNTTDEKANSRPIQTKHVKKIAGQNKTVTLEKTITKRTFKPNTQNENLNAKDNNNITLKSKPVVKKSPNKNSAEKFETSNRSLRSRDIDLSTTLDSEKVSNKENIDTGKQSNRKNTKAKSIKNAETEKRAPFKLRGKELASTTDSDVSFSLSNTIIAKRKRVGRPPAKLNDSYILYGQSNRSDLSFTLNSPMTRKRSQEMGNITNPSVISKPQSIVSNLSVTRSAKKTPVTKICSIKSKRISANSKKR